jgi:hypothetical protein
MSDSKRLHRNDPARNGPIRNFSGLYQWSGSDCNPAGSSQSQTADGVPPQGQDASRDEGVGLAYHVIEKHIREGKRNAGQFNSQPYTTRAVTDGFQEILERTLRFQTELLPLWIEALSSAVRVDPMQKPHTPGTAWRQESNSTASRSSSRAISIEIASVRPVQVSLDLRENSESPSLLCLGLRAVDENKPPLNGISLTPETTRDALTLRIPIPDAHPPGIYSGVIVDGKSGETRGTLSVRITG